MILDFSPDFSTHFAYIREFLAKFPELLRREQLLQLHGTPWNILEPSGMCWNVLEHSYDVIMMSSFVTSCSFVLTHVMTSYFPMTSSCIVITQPMTSYVPT